MPNLRLGVVLPVDSNHEEGRIRCPAGQFLIVRLSKNSTIKARDNDLRIEEEQRLIRAERTSLVRLPRSGWQGHRGKGANGGSRHIWQSEPINRTRRSGS